MKTKPTPRRQIITTVQRAQIVQHVIVDGWTNDKVATAFGVSSRLVEVWVDDYRRYGMASLRQDPRRTFVAETLQLSVWRPLRATLHKIFAGVFGSLTPEPLVQPLPLRRSNKDGPH
ncbi:MAG: helix-turn-helix domain-containing protein [Alphaproteobacteria bacterium]|nr:helix-turn-helix domain-containing protein [Alphaproteobacteria bacterium]